MPAVVAQQDIALGNVTRNNIGQLKVMHKKLFPVNYGVGFYDEVLSAGEYAKLAYFNDVCVGSVCCRKETAEDVKRVYMMTLGVLEPYRSWGLGRKLLEHIIKHARDDQYQSIYLHVQTVNTQAVDFYKRNGFKVVNTVPEYYKNIEDRDAFILENDLSTPPPALPNTLQ